jgi:DNA-binding NtrC family response regulator
MSAKPESILVVDDEPGMCRLLEKVLGDEGWAVSAFVNPAEAVEALHRQPFDAVVTDIRMPKLDGFDVLEAVRSQRPDAAVILITAHGSVETAVEAMKRGAADFIAKPFRNEEIRQAVYNVLERRRLRKENERLRRELESRHSFGGLSGASAVMKSVIDELAQVSESDVSVLIQGESGTGKELAARAIHYNGPRRAGPFVAVHCGSLPETLAESELFGHKKGAFTDALRDRKGLLESAEGGTILLDEVGDMPAALQVKLLRFLQDREVRPLGGSEARRVDVRVLAATHRDLKKAVAEGTFREDLYYRLAVVTVWLPPLRERKEDIGLLADRFLAEASGRAGKQGAHFTEAALRVLASHRWPGNVRELQNAVQHAVALHPGPALGPETLPSGLRAGAGRTAPREDLSGLPHREAKHRALESFERSYWSSLLSRAGGNLTKAAELAGIDRKNMYDIFKKYGIEPGAANQPQP